ncbi:MAG: WbqC family protein [Bacteroides sp.]|nr:WbqC family protein [Bacteroides sp.]
MPPRFPQHTAYLSSAYMAPVSWYSKLYHYGHIRIEQYDHYLKQTYRNRCTLAGPNGTLALTVPIVKPDTLKCPMKDIRISDHGHWRHQHWNAIESAYNSTPFFEYYREDLQPFYEQKFEFLTDFNESLCHSICELIDLQPDMRRTGEYRKAFGPRERDLREAIHPKKGNDPEFTIVPYYQVFEDRHGFLSDLSILDLLFNMGPESLLVLQRS